ncbi:MAG: ferric iron uptake transcriptional regulator [Candidatus Eutrophobiaceae bacterium]
MTAQDLKKRGLRVTMPRMRVLQILEEAKKGEHLSVEEVHQAFRVKGEEVELATIYRILHQFEYAGLIIRHNFDSGHSVYELDRGSHHDHMICLDTGKVIEFQNEVIEKLQVEVAEEHGYELHDHSLVLYVRKKKS